MAPLFSKRQRDVRLFSLLRRQFGVFSRAQALGLSVTDKELSHSVHKGELVRVCYGVYRAAAVEETWHQKVMVGWLRGGDSAFASHQCAAAAWGLDGYRQGVVEISTHRRIASTNDCVFHRVREPWPGDVQPFGPFRVSSPTRTLIEIAGSSDLTTVELALDDCLRKGLTSVARVRWRLDQVGAKGMRGAVGIRRILDERDPGLRPESLFERKFLRLLSDHRFPQPQTQYDIRDASGLIGRVDFAYPPARVAVEADGYRFHSGKAQWEKDRVRRNRLEAAEWRVLHATWDQIAHRPDDVLGPLRALLLDTFGDQLALSGS